MEINTLPGTIIGLIGNFNLKDDYNNMKIKDILGEKSDKALKIVNLTIFAFYFVLYIYILFISSNSIKYFIK